MAVRTWAPTARVVVLRETCPFERVVVPIVVPLSARMTVPVGTTVPDAWATVAVMATDWPAVVLGGVAVSVVMVATGCVGETAPTVDH